MLHDIALWYLEFFRVITFDERNLVVSQAQ